MSDLTDELKRQLLDASNDYKEEIQAALKAVSEKLGRTGINALIITGALVTSYLLYRGISGGGARKTKKLKKAEGAENDQQEYTIIDRMADQVLEQSLVFLLTVAKEKLIAYLNESNSDEESSDSASAEA